jgi:hypothetical protein
MELDEDFQPDPVVLPFSFWIVLLGGHWREVNSTRATQNGLVVAFTLGLIALGIALHWTTVLIVGVCLLLLLWLLFALEVRGYFQFAEQWEQARARTDFLHQLRTRPHASRSRFVRETGQSVAHLQHQYSITEEEWNQVLAAP